MPLLSRRDHSPDLDELLNRHSYFSASGRALLTASIVWTAVYGGTMTDGLAEEPARTWQTDQAKLLDSPELINSTVRVLKGAVPGTGKSYDSQRVSDEIVQILFAELKEERGIHGETVLATLGALAGFSVQMALRETLVKTGKMPEDKVFIIVKTKSGENFYLGELTNGGLFGVKSAAYSVFAIVGGGAQEAGAKELPDVKDINRYVVSTIGSDKFGIPRVPAAHMPHALPIDLLSKFWNPVRNLLVLKVQEPLQWPLVLALAAQKVIVMYKDLLDPALAGKLVMETAVAMAEVDPTKIHYAYFQAY